MAMTINQMNKKYPVGTVIKLTTDYPLISHSVVGYRLQNKSSFLLFADGSSLNTARKNLIKEIL